MNQQNKQQALVWDIGVRTFHWVLVIMFTTSYLTGELLEDDKSWHAYSGYVIVTLLVLRIIRGFVGSPHARFSDFVYGPGAVVGYLKSLLNGHPQHYLGHNPAGGWMVVLLLVFLLFSCLSGLKLYGLDGHGPLAASDISLISSAQASGDDDHGDNHEEKESPEEELWEEIHGFFTTTSLLLVLIHIAGVIVSSRLHKENLVRAMITGRKETPPGPHE